MNKLNQIKYITTFIFILTLSFIPHQTQAQSLDITYGFVRDTADPQLVTAIAYPQFTSDNITIATAQFTVLLPTGTATEPTIPVAPETGTFTDITGIWQALKLTPDAWSAASENANDLEGFDLYQVTLQNSPEIVANSGGRIPLFSFRLAESCGETSGRVLANDETIQQEVRELFGNVNNQMSMSIDDAPAADVYRGNSTDASEICSSPMVADSGENTTTGGDAGVPTTGETGDSSVYLPVVMR
ncbi:MAG: hypothetical protein AAF639_03635 [Chloroflexota bacterium]